MTTPLKLTGFAAVLAVAFGGAALAGGTSAPDPQPDEPAGHGGGGRHGTTGATHTALAPDTPVRGLAVADRGLRLVVAAPELRRAHTERVRFAIVDARGQTVSDFDVAHEKRMHMIVVRRDLTGFQHLHPEQTPDGAWEASVRLDDAGYYRLFADFTRHGRSTTLATDLRVDGAAGLRALPAPDPTAVSDGGYDVRLTSGRVRPGKPADLRFAITRGGKTVHVEPYLGAGGHLVALREGDLAFLHVHPSDHGAGDTHDDSVGFEATFPTQGRYRLFLQFKHEDRVHTVAFTQEVN